MKTSTARTAKQNDAIKADLDQQAKLRAEDIAGAPVNEVPDDAAEQMKAVITSGLLKLFGMNEDAPSWKRQLAAFFASAIIAGGAGYAIGQLAGYAILGVAMLGGSVMWMYLIFIMAMMLSIYTGLKIGQYVGNYILSGQVDKDAAKVKSWIVGAKDKAVGVFKREPSTTILVATPA